MKKIIAILSVIILCACSNGTNLAENEKSTFTDTEQGMTKTQSSFPYPLVKWNNIVYKVTKDEITDVDREVGEIVTYSTNESEASSQNNFSNYFPEGTKIWSIDGVDSKGEIAIEFEEGKYFKAVSSENK